MIVAYLSPRRKRVEDEEASASRGCVGFSNPREFRIEFARGERHRAFVRMRGWGRGWDGGPRAGPEQRSRLGLSNARRGCDGVESGMSPESRRPLRYCYPPNTGNTVRVPVTCPEDHPDRTISHIAIAARWGDMLDMRRMSFGTPDTLNLPSSGTPTVIRFHFIPLSSISSLYTATSNISRGLFICGCVDISVRISTDQVCSHLGAFFIWGYFG